MKRWPLLALGLLLALPGVAGCGSSAAVTITLPRPLVELLPIDEAASRRLQQEGVTFHLPAGEIILRPQMRDYFGNIQRDMRGNELTVPWALGQEPLVPPADVVSVTNPGTDAQGKPSVVIRLNDDGAARLGHSGGSGTATGGGASPPRLAVVIDSKVRAVLPAVRPPADQLSFECSYPEALEIEAMFANGGQSGGQSN